MAAVHTQRVRFDLLKCTTSPLTPRLTTSMYHNSIHNSVRCVLDVYIVPQSACTLYVLTVIVYGLYSMCTETGQNVEFGDWSRGAGSRKLVRNYGYRIRRTMIINSVL